MTFQSTCKREIENVPYLHSVVRRRRSQISVIQQVQELKIWPVAMLGSNQVVVSVTNYRKGFYNTIQ
jgi:hypothetical protein